MNAVNHPDLRRALAPRDGTFWGRVDSSRGAAACWPWSGARHSKGYGRLYWQGADMKAHRLALILTAGPPPTPDHMALHSCDNPPCCNPAHLRWGTNGENMLDMFARDRQSDAARKRATCRRGHPLAGENVITNASTGKRKCRECANAAKRIQNRRLRAPRSGQDSGPVRSGVPEPSGDHSAGRPPVGSPGLDPVVSGTDGGVQPRRHSAG